MWMGLIQSAEELNRTKRLTLFQVKENSPADYLWTSSAPSALPGLESAGPYCKFGLANLYTCVSQFLIINFFLYIFTSHWFCFSGEP